MNRTKEELLLECVRQFEHIENVLGFNRLSTTKSLINEINQALRIHDVSGQSEQLLCGDLIRHNFSISKIGVCLDCKFIKDKAK